MFKILLATDGSKHALKAAEYATRIVGQMKDASVTLLYVGQATEPVFSYLSAGRGMVNQDTLEQAINEMGQEVLGRTGKVLEQAGIQTTSQLEIGDPSAVISRVAEEGRYDLIVLGSRGLTDLQGLLVGSVSDRVTHQSKVSVLIVR